MRPCTLSAFWAARNTAKPAARQISDAEVDSDATRNCPQICLGELADHLADALHANRLDVVDHHLRWLA
jgi:hypothetical protein